MVKYNSQVICNNSLIYFLFFVNKFMNKYRLYKTISVILIYCCVIIIFVQKLIYKKKKDILKGFWNYNTYYRINTL